MTEPRIVPPPDLGFDPDALQQKYRRERDKRIRADGVQQYIDPSGSFDRFAQDPYVEPGFSRDPLTDEVDVVVIGGGFTGLVTAARLIEAGVRDVRIIEKGGDVGGVWYWNRYPGIRCDVDSYIYLPLLEEIGTVPSEKYSAGGEILDHCRAIAKRFDLYANSCFQTQVTSISWDDEQARWTVRTDRDDEIKARFVCLGSGGLDRPRLPAIPGIESFTGHSFHTSRWDYSYTGGKSDGGMTGLRDKKVAIIGTAASAIQCIPLIADSAERLTVFQRTPAIVDARNNRPTDVEWFKNQEPGWQRRRAENFTSIIIGKPQTEDLVDDRITALYSRATKPRNAGAQEPPQVDPGMAPAQRMQLANYTKMEEIRARVGSIVSHPEVAESLKPYYNLGCKRPQFSDVYLQTFNDPDVTLVDTQGAGVDRITETGVVFDDHEYEVDCIIYATGFASGVATANAGGFEVVGRGGTTLSDKWAGGTRTLHGVYMNGFPNLFVIGGIAQASLTINFTHILDEQATHVAALIQSFTQAGVKTMEVRPEAEQRWAQTLAAKAVDRSKVIAECPPGDHLALLGSVYGGGPFEYIEICRQWREKDFENDLDLTYE